MFDERIYDKYISEMQAHHFDGDALLNDFMKSALVYHYAPYRDLSHGLEAPNELNDGRIDWSLDPFCEIHPYKRNDVCSLLFAYDIPTAVSRIIVFGSSVTQECREDDDLDAIIVANSGFSRDDLRRWQPFGKARVGKPRIGRFDLRLAYPEELRNARGVVREALTYGITVYDRDKR